MTARISLALLSAAALLACGSPTPMGPVDAGPGLLPPDAGTQTAAAPTWHQDVAPIVSENCSGCHAEGGVAFLPFNDYASAEALAHTIALSVRSGQMPPWPPSAPPMRHERGLTEEEIATLEAWAAAGAPEGDAATAAPLPPPEEIDIGTPELSLDIGVDYVPASDEPDDYRCFLVPLGTTENRMATGYKVTPGAVESVHHVLVYLFDAGDRATLEALDGSDGRPGWSCFSGPTPQNSAAQPVDGLGGWVPGTSAVQLTPGVGVQLTAGMLSVVQVHYHVRPGTSRADRTKIEVALASPEEAAGLQRQMMLVLPKTDLFIPSGAEDHSEVFDERVSSLTGGLFFPDGDAYVVGVIGHMHLLGTRFSLTLTDGMGISHPVLEIPDWDFDWQGTYQLATPLRFGPSDRVRMECRWDNSAAHRRLQGFESETGDVTWGEGSFDEMCLAYVMVTDDLPTP